MNLKIKVEGSEFRDTYLVKDNTKSWIQVTFFNKI